MDLTDPRARGFDAAKFRDAIGFAMAMGMPETAAERVTFFWDDELRFASEDPSHRPYDWTATPDSQTSSTRTPVSVNVAVDPGVVASRTHIETGVGEFQQSALNIYVLDTDYEQVYDADYVVVDGQIYDIVMWAAPVGLFSVTLHTCVVRVRDAGGNSRMS